MGLGLDGYAERAQGVAVGITGGLGSTSPGLATLLLPLAVGSIGIFTAFSAWFVVLASVTIV